MIDLEIFAKWAEKTFGLRNVLIKGQEVTINSPWTDDVKHHLWCSPHGGKKGVENGVYRCFKTEKRGTLVGLVMEFENCDYDDAVEILEGGSSLREMEAKLEIFLSQLKPQSMPLKSLYGMKLPEHSFLITSMHEDSENRKEAEKYLNKRKITSDGLYYCINGDYGRRIIMPYYDMDGNLIYFNGRYIGDNKKTIRYMGPPKQLGIGKGDVLYMYKWPNKGSRVYVTEGEFDARTLNLCGYYGVACGGKYFTEKQLMMLKPYNLCLCFDTDLAGFQAQVGTDHVDKRWRNLNELIKTDDVKLGNPFQRSGFTNVTFVRPPKIFKDWNQMMCEVGPELVKEYINKCEKRFDSFMVAELLATTKH